MDRLESLRLFVAVAETGSFTLAARRAACSTSAVTRAVAQLETRLSAQLFHRTTRRVRLTEGGERFLGDCRRLLLELERAEAAVSGAARELSGPLTVTASVMFGRLFVAPLALDFLALHPNVKLRMVLLDRVVDMMEEGIDVAIRIANLPDSSLAAQRVGSVRRVVCAAPEYLARHGEPRTLADLARCEVVAFGSDAPHWTFRVKNKAQTIRPPARLLVNSTEVSIQAAVAGHGLTRALIYQVAPELRTGKLKIVLAKYEPPALPIHVIHREGSRAASKVRNFVDFAAQRLRAESYIGTSME